MSNGQGQGSGRSYRGERRSLEQALADAARASEAQAEALKNQLRDESTFLGGVWATLVDWSKAFWSWIWSGFQGWFDYILEPIYQFFTGNSMRVTENGVDHMLDIFRSWGAVDEDDERAIRDIIASAGQAGDIAGAVTGILMLARIFGAFTDVLGGTIIQNLNKKFSPSIPSPEGIARVSFLAPELHERVVELAKRAGYSKDDIELMFLSNYALYSPNEVAQLYLRGKLDEEGAFNRLQEMGFTAARIDEMKELWSRLPGPQDMIRYLAKEVFEPGMIELFGLMEDYPGDAETFFAMHGLDARWAKAEWVSHWQDPGLQFMLAALHRNITLSDGTDVDFNFLDRYMALIEIPPKLREIIVKTAYNPYTRVDTRRMYEDGVLSREQVKRSYLDQGYDEEKAENLTEWTARQADKAGKQLTRSDVETAYRDGDIDYDTAISGLMVAGYREEYADFLISRVALKKEREAREDKTAVIRDRYTNNLISDVEARNRLLGIGYNISRTSELIEKWEIERYQNLRMPSKTDLDKFLKAGIINETVYRQELGKHGYSQTYINWYAALATGAEG